MDEVVVLLRLDVRLLTDCIMLLEELLERRVGARARVDRRGGAVRRVGETGECLAVGVVGLSVSARAAMPRSEKVREGERR